jgi:hypothetical protein
MKYILLILLFLTLIGCDALKGQKGDRGDNGTSGTDTIFEPNYAIDTYEFEIPTSTCTAQMIITIYSKMLIQTYEWQDNAKWADIMHTYYPDEKRVHILKSGITTKFKINVSHSNEKTGVSKLLY